MNNPKEKPFDFYEQENSVFKELLGEEKLYPEPVSEKTLDWLCKCGVLHSTGTYCGQCDTSAPGILTPTYPLTVTRENNRLRAEIATIKDAQAYLNKCLATKDEDKEKLYKEINSLHAQLDSSASHARKEALREVQHKMRNWMHAAKPAFDEWITSELAKGTE